ncbi:MAG: aminotransferase class I/II-fold pyridoxal phosphate-dependent enzyme [Candidatus Omnitrophica bacterium]|nr:aminotransferase class I/II-fold pyridoxal phosphate-dependent enzyme [Candidatus Omnitrophota bacterium]
MAEIPLSAGLTKLFQGLGQTQPDMVDRFLTIQESAKKQWLAILEKHPGELKMAVVIPAYSRGVDRIRSQDSLTLKLLQLKKLAEADTRGRVRFVIYVVDDKPEAGLQAEVDRARQAAGVTPEGPVQVRYLRLQDAVDKRRPDLKDLWFDLVPGEQGSRRSIKWGAVRYGMSVAVEEGARVVGMTDADSNQQASELPNLFAPILLEDRAAAVGSRFLNGSASNNDQIGPHNFIEYFLYNPLVKLAMPEIAPIEDLQSGLKAFSAKFLKAALPKMATHKFAGDSELLFLMAQAGGRIAEVPRSEIEESPGQSAVNPASYMSFVEQLKLQLVLHAGGRGFPPAASRFGRAIQGLNVGFWTAQRRRFEQALNEVQAGRKTHAEVEGLLHDLLFPATGLEEGEEFTGEAHPGDIIWNPNDPQGIRYVVDRLEGGRVVAHPEKEPKAVVRFHPDALKRDFKRASPPLKTLKERAAQVPAEVQELSIRGGRRLEKQRAAFYRIQDLIGQDPEVLRRLKSVRVGAKVVLYGATSEELSHFQGLGLEPADYDFVLLEPVSNPGMAGDLVKKAWMKASVVFAGISVMDFITLVQPPGVAGSKERLPFPDWADPAKPLTVVDQFPEGAAAYLAKAERVISGGPSHSGARVAWQTLGGGVQGLGKRGDVRVSHVSRVGEGTEGEKLLVSLRDLRESGEGVEVSGMKPAKGRVNASTLVLSQPEGKRNFIHQLGASNELTPADVPDSAFQGEIFSLHGSELAQRFMKGGKGVIALLERAKAAGAITTWDTVVDPFQHWGSGNLSDRDFEKLLSLIDVFTPSFGEALDIIRLREGLSDAQVKKWAPSQAARYFLDRGSEALFLKLDEKGSLIWTTQRSIFGRPAHFRMPVLWGLKKRDGTGTGDAYSAAVIVGILMDWPVEKIARVATAAGGLVLENYGGTLGDYTFPDVLKAAERLEGQIDVKMALDYPTLSLWEVRPGGTSAGFPEGLLPEAKPELDTLLLLAVRPDEAIAVAEGQPDDHLARGPVDRLRVRLNGRTGPLSPSEEALAEAVQREPRLGSTRSTQEQSDLLTYIASALLIPPAIDDPSAAGLEEKNRKPEAASAVWDGLTVDQAAEMLFAYRLRKSLYAGRKIFPVAGSKSFLDTMFNGEIRSWLQTVANGHPNESLKLVDDGTTVYASSSATGLEEGGQEKVQNEVQEALLRFQGLLSHATSKDLHVLSPQTLKRLPDLQGLGGFGLFLLPDSKLPLDQLPGAIKRRLGRRPKANFYGAGAETTILGLAAPGAGGRSGWLNLVVAGNGTLEEFLAGTLLPGLGIPDKHWKGEDDLAQIALDLWTLAPARAAGLEEKPQTEDQEDEWGGVVRLNLYAEPDRDDRIVIYNLGGSRAVWVKWLKTENPSRISVGFLAADAGGRHLPGDVVVLSGETVQRALDEAQSPQWIWPASNRIPDLRDPGIRVAIRKAMEKRLSEAKASFLQVPPAPQEMEFRDGGYAVVFDTAGDDPSSWRPVADLSVLPKNQRKIELVLSALGEVNLDRKSQSQFHQENDQPAVDPWGSVSSPLVSGDAWRRKVQSQLDDYVTVVQAPPQGHEERDPDFPSKELLEGVHSIEGSLKDGKGPAVAEVIRKVRGNLRALERGGRISPVDFEALDDLLETAVIEAERPRRLPAGPSAVPPRPLDEKEAPPSEFAEGIPLGPAAEPPSGLEETVQEKFGKAPFAVGVRLHGSTIAAALVNRKGEVETTILEPTQWRKLPEILELLGNPPPDRVNKAILELIPRPDHILSSEQRDLASRIGDRITEEVIQHILALVRSSGLPREKFKYTFISFAGPVDPVSGRAGVPFAAPNIPGFENYPLAEKVAHGIEKELGMKVRVDVRNDAPSGRMGETSPSGTIPGAKGVISMIWGTGINADSDTVPLFEVGHAIVGRIEEDGLAHYEFRGAAENRPALEPDEFEVEQQLGGEVLAAVFRQYGFKDGGDLTQQAAPDNSDQAKRDSARSIIEDVGKDMGRAIASLLAHCRKEHQFVPTRFVLTAGVAEKFGKGLVDSKGRDLLTGAVQDGASQELVGRFNVSKADAETMVKAVIRSSMDDRREFAAAASALPFAAAGFPADGLSVLPVSETSLEFLKKLNPDTPAEFVQHQLLMDGPQRVAAVLEKGKETQAVGMLVAGRLFWGTWEDFKKAGLTDEQSASAFLDYLRNGIHEAQVTGFRNLFIERVILRRSPKNGSVHLQLSDGPVQPDDEVTSMVLLHDKKHNLENLAHSRSKTPLPTGKAAKPPKSGLEEKPPVEKRVTGKTKLAAGDLLVRRQLGEPIRGYQITKIGWPQWWRGITVKQTSIEATPPPLPRVTRRILKSDPTWTHLPLAGLREEDLVRLGLETFLSKITPGEKAAWKKEGREAAAKQKQHKEEIRAALGPYAAPLPTRTKPKPPFQVTQGAREFEILKTQVEKEGHLVAVEPTSYYPAADGGISSENVGSMVTSLLRKARMGESELKHIAFFLPGTPKEERTPRNVFVVSLDQPIFQGKDAPQTLKTALDAVLKYLLSQDSKETPTERVQVPLARWKPPGASAQDPHELVPVILPVPPRPDPTAGPPQNRRAGLEEAAGAFLAGVVEQTRAEQDPYAPLLGTDEAREAAARYLTSQWTAPERRIDPSQLFITPGGAGALELLIRMAADVTDAPLKALRDPNGRQWIWLSKALEERYGKPARKYLQTKAFEDSTLGSFMISLYLANPQRGTPKIILLKISDFPRADDKEWLDFLKYASANQILVVFEDSEGPTPTMGKLMRWVQENPLYKRTTLFMTDFGKRLDLDDYPLGALVGFNNALVTPYQTAAGGSIAAPSQAVQKGISRWLALKVSPGAGDGWPQAALSLPDVPQNKGFLAPPYLEGKPDPTLALSSRALWKERGLPRFLPGVSDENVLSRAIPLHVGAPSVPRPKWARQAVEEALKSNRWKSWEELEQAVVEAMIGYIRRTYGVEYLVDDVATGLSGSKTALQEFLLALEHVEKKPVSAALPNPHYVGYGSSLRAVIPDKQIHRFGTQRENDFVPTIDDIQAALDEMKQSSPEATRVLILTSPGNPTGTVISQELLEKLDALLQEKGYEDVHVVLDVAYGQLLFEGKQLQLNNLSDSVLTRVALLMTQSKEILQPGGRLGTLAIANPAIVGRMLDQRVLKADRAAMVAQAVVYGQEHVEEFNAFISKHVEHLKRNAKLLTHILRKHGVDFIPPQGAFYLLFKKERFLELDAEFTPWDLGLTYVDGNAFYAPEDEWWRIAFSGPTEQVEKAARRLDEWLTAHSLAATGLEEGAAAAAAPTVPEALASLNGLEKFWQLPDIPAAEGFPELSARPILIDTHADPRLGQLAQALSIMMAKDPSAPEVDFLLVARWEEVSPLLEGLSQINREAAEEFLKPRIIAYGGSEGSRENARREAIVRLARRFGLGDDPEKLIRSGSLKVIGVLTPDLALELKDFLGEVGLHFTQDAYDRLKALLEAA